MDNHQVVAIMNSRQVMAMYTVVADLGFLVPLQFQVTSREDTSGDVIVDITNADTGITGRYRLAAGGGCELLNTTVV